MSAYKTLFHQGTELMLNNESNLKTIQSNLVLMTEKTSSCNKQEKGENVLNGRERNPNSKEEVTEPKFRKKVIALNWSWQI